MTRLADTFLRDIPKTDLHVHLDGSLRPETLIELAGERRVRLPSATADGLYETVFKERYENLVEYLRGFQYTCSVLTDAEALERAAYELAVDNLAEGVRYIEVRFAPHLHARSGFPVVQVLTAVDRGLRRAQSEHELSERVRAGGEPPFRYGIIACAMRHFEASYSPYFEQLIRAHAGQPRQEIFVEASLALVDAMVEARDHHGTQVVGLDLAGAEAGHPASDYIEAFRRAHQRFFKKTVHAGEAFGPESIFQAITDLHADRIGHGTHLYSGEQVTSADPEAYVSQLIDFIADRRVTIEVCLSSNLQTIARLRRPEDHPLGRMVEDRLSVTLCTDNRLMSRTSVTREFQRAISAFEFSPQELRNLVVHGFKRSFFPGAYAEKRAYVRSAMDYYDRVVHRHGDGSSLPAAEPRRAESRNGRGRNSVDLETR